MLCKAQRKAVLVTLDTATPCPGKDTALPGGARLLYLPQAPQEVLGAGTATAVALAQVPLALKDQGWQPLLPPRGAPRARVTIYNKTILAKEVPGPAFVTGLNCPDQPHLVPGCSI